MCYVTNTYLTDKQVETLREYYNLPALDWKFELHHHSVHGFSHREIPAITEHKKLEYLNWGLVPSWSKDWDRAQIIRKSTLNAKAETIDQKPSFRQAFKSSRCLIPVKGFYEWQHYAGAKIPYFIYPKNNEPALLAGLHEHWVDQHTGEVINSATIITKPANTMMEHIHNNKKRMPVILTHEQGDLWLDMGIPPSELKKLLIGSDEVPITAHTISRKITSRKDNPDVPEVTDKYDWTVELIGFEPVVA